MAVSNFRPRTFPLPSLGEKDLSGKLAFPELNRNMEKTLGEILVEKNIISQTQLDIALRRQKQQKGKYLGQVLIEMGVAPQDKINQVLNTFNKRKRIGEILVDLQVVSPQQLEEALQKQKEMQRKGVRKLLGTIVLEMGFTNYDDYLKALSKHFNMPIVSLDTFYPTPSLQKAVGEKYAQKHKIVVLEDSPTRVKIALAEPTHYILEEIQKSLHLGKRAEFFLANPYEVENTLRKKFDPFSLTKYK